MSCDISEENKTIVGVDCSVGNLYLSSGAKVGFTLNLTPTFLQPYSNLTPILHQSYSIKLDLSVLTACWKHHQLKTNLN